MTEDLYAEDPLDRDPELAFDWDDTEDEEDPETEAALVTELDAARGLVRVRVCGNVPVWLPAGALEELR